jgi:DME family drug/metabolite transporter
MNAKRNYLLIILAGVCFGTTGTAQALGPDGVSSLAVGASRLPLGAFLIWLYLKRSHFEKQKLNAKLIWISAIGVLAYQLAFFSAVRITGVAIGTVTALGSVPVLTGIVDFLWHKNKPKFNWLIATLFTTIGIFLLGTAKGISEFKPAGFLLALGAGLSFSIFTVASKQVLRSGADTTYVMFETFKLAGFLALPILFFSGFTWIASTDGFAMLFWLALVPTAIAYVSYAKGLVGLRSSVANTLVLAEPATATILASVVLHETLTQKSWIGILLVAAGLLYLSLSSEEN